MTSKTPQTFGYQPQRLAGTKRFVLVYQRSPFDEKIERWKPALGWIKKSRQRHHSHPQEPCFSQPALRHLGGLAPQTKRGRQTTKAGPDGSPQRPSMLRASAR